MNLAIASSRPINSFSSVRKVNLLPTTAKVTVPAGLDWVILQRLTEVSAFAALGVHCTDHRVDDLSRLIKLLSQDDRRDIHQVSLYGYELAIFYSFLLEQEQCYHAWSRTHVPVKAIRTIRADLRGLLPKLHALCRQVDVFADRPVRDR